MKKVKIYGHNFDVRYGSIAEKKILELGKIGPNDEDRALLAEHGKNGLRYLGLYGVLDRLDLL